MAASKKVRYVYIYIYSMGLLLFLLLFALASILRREQFDSRIIEDHGHREGTVRQPIKGGLAHVQLAFCIPP